MKKIFDILGKAFISVFLFIMIIGLMMWGVGDIFRNSGPNTVAKVGNLEISSYELQNLVNKSANQLSPDLPEDVKTKILNYFTQSSLSYLINKALVKNEVDNLSLNLDPAEIIKNEYLSVPNFTQENLKALIRQDGGEKAFLQKIETQKRADFIESAITSAIPFTEEGYDLVYKYDNQKRDIKYVEVDQNIKNFDPIKAEESDLVEYYNKNKAQFKAQDTRSFTYITIDKNALKNEIEESEDEEGEVDYFQAFSRVNSYILDRLAEETPLEDIAKELDIKLIKLSNVDSSGLNAQKNQANIPDIQGFVDVVFSLDEGIASDLLENENGDLFSVVRLDSVSEGKYKAFDEVKALVKKNFQAEQKAKKFAEYIATLEKDFAENTISFDKFVTQNSLKPKQIKDVYRGFPDLPQSFIGDIFSTDLGQSVKPHASKKGRFIIGKVEAIYPPEGENDLDKLTIKSNVQEQITQELLSQYLAYLSGKYNIENNFPQK